MIILVQQKFEMRDEKKKIIECNFNELYIGLPLKLFDQYNSKIIIVIIIIK